MVKSRDGEVVVSVRLNADDVAAMEWLRGFIRAQVGAGVHLGNADVIRWALHAARSGVENGVAEHLEG